jgi:hypothetical protein
MPSLSNWRFNTLQSQLNVGKLYNLLGLEFKIFLSLDAHQPRWLSRVYFAAKGARTRFIET